MKKTWIVLGLTVLSSCNQQGGYYEGEKAKKNQQYYEETMPEGYYGGEKSSGDSYYRDPARNPKNEPRSNWRLW